MFYSIEIEYVVLATLLAQRDELYDEINFISSDDFCTLETKNIFEAIKNSPKNDALPLILSKLSGDNERKILTQAIDMAVNSTASFNTYVVQLKKQAQAIKTQTILKSILRNENRLVEIEEIEKSILDLKLKSGIEHFSNVEKQNRDLHIAGFADRILKKKELFKTGLPDLDNLIFGFERGTVSIVGALPSAGKTTFALNIVNRFVDDGKKILFFSLEMNTDMVYQRFMANWCSMDYGKIVNQNFDNKDKNTVRNFGKMLQAISDTYIIYDNIYDISEIIGKIKSENPDFVVIDYIQIVRAATAKLKDRRGEIDYIITEIKQAAKAVNCHIMVLSQLARTTSNKLSMNLLKESGALEANGDYIMILDRPYVRDKSAEFEPSQADLLVDKNKFGNTGKIELFFDGQYQKFSCVAYGKYEIQNENDE